MITAFPDRTHLILIIKIYRSHLMMSIRKDKIGRVVQIQIIPTQCFYRFFGDFDWSVGKIKLFLHFDKNPCVGILDNCLDFTVLDCVDNNELYRKLYNFYQIKYS